MFDRVLKTPLLNAVQLIRKAKNSDYCESSLIRNLNVGVRWWLPDLTSRIWIGWRWNFGPTIDKICFYLYGIAMLYLANPIWKVLTIVNTTSKIWTWVQKQPTEVFYKKAVLKNFAVFTGKQLCWTLFLLKSERLLLWVQSLLNRDAQ